MSDRVVKLLIVEDSPDDIRLMERVLRRSGFEFVVSSVTNEVDLRKALGEERFGLVLTDHGMGGMDSLDVLRVLEEVSPGLPCILVSGKVGEEAVSRAMLRGATDYVAKDNLDRLPTAVERAMVAKERRSEQKLSKDALLESGKLFRAVFAHAGDAMVIFDDDRHLIDFNPAAEVLFGVSKAEAVQKKLDDLAPELIPDEESDFWKRFVAADDRRGEMDVHQSGDGFISVEYTIAAGFMKGRHMMVMRDISERQHAEAEVRRRVTQQKSIADLSEQALRGRSLGPLFESTVDLMSETLEAEIAGVLQLVPEDGQFEVKWTRGMGPLQPGDRTPFMPPNGSQASFTIGQEAVVRVDDYELEERFSRADILDGTRSGISVRIQGELHPFGILGSVSSRPNAFNADDEAFLTAAANLLADAIERDRREQEVRHRALHDSLTGLANRSLFTDILYQALAEASRDGSKLAVMSLGLDDFKSVNDSYGHRAADQLLIQIASRMRRAIGSADTVARFGGDEFVVLFREVSGEDEAELRARQLLSKFDVPFSSDVGGQSMISTSAGMALGGDTGFNGDRLLHDADIALHRSKERGRAMLTIATEEMRSEVMERFKLKQALERAIGTDQLSLEYQPIIDLNGGGMVGVEALARWRHPERGPISPGLFIPIAEQSGLILRLGEWVLREACLQAVAWREEFGEGRPGPVNVNISARQVAQLDLAELVAEVFEDTGAKASEIAIEITESVLISNFGEPMMKLQELRMMGVKVFLDDFGTGFSSLSYLDRFPIDTLKIDRSFVSPLGVPEHPAPVVTAIVSMSGALGIATVAEGVENADQAASVAAMGCRYAQGYFYARPGPASEIEALLIDDAPVRARAAEVLAVKAAAIIGS